LAIVVSAIFANGLFAPQHSIDFVILEEERDLPDCNPYFTDPLFSSENPCGVGEGLLNVVSPLRPSFLASYKNSFIGFHIPVNITRAAKLSVNGFSPSLSASCVCSCTKVK